MLSHQFRLLSATRREHNPSISSSSATEARCESNPFRLLLFALLVNSTIYRVHHFFPDTEYIQYIMHFTSTTVAAFCLTVGSAVAFAPSSPGTFFRFSLLFGWLCQIFSFLGKNNNRPLPRLFPHMTSLLLSLKKTKTNQIKSINILQPLFQPTW